MATSFVQLFVHAVWATRLREPLLREAVARRVHGYMASRCRSLRCEALAIGGADDHVHVLAMLAPDVSVAQLVAGIKAPTSTFAKRELNVTVHGLQGAPVLGR